MTSFYLWLAALVLGGGSLAGIITVMLHQAKKIGQKSTEAEIIKEDSRRVQDAAQTIAERRTSDDTARKLSDNKF